MRRDGVGIELGIVSQLLDKIGRGPRRIVSAGFVDDASVRALETKRTGIDLPRCIWRIDSCKPRRRRCSGASELVV